MIPKYKAEKYDSTEEIEGMLMLDKIDEGGVFDNIQTNGLFIQTQNSYKGYLDIHRIKKSTIKINFPHWQKSGEDKVWIPLEEFENNSTDFLIKTYTAQQKKNTKGS